jgi:hypothetical protein
MPAARVKTSIQRLGARRLHDRLHVAAADTVALLAQQIAGHAAVGEAMVQVQFVDNAH